MACRRSQETAENIKTVEGTEKAAAPAAGTKEAGATSVEATKPLDEDVTMGDGPRDTGAAVKGSMEKAFSVQTGEFLQGSKERQSQLEEMIAELESKAPSRGNITSLVAALLASTDPEPPPLKQLGALAAEAKKYLLAADSVLLAAKEAFADWLAAGNALKATLDQLCSEEATLRQGTVLTQVLEVDRQKKEVAGTLQIVAAGLDKWTVSIEKQEM